MLGSGAGSGAVPGLQRALCHTNATLRVGAEDAEGPKGHFWHPA